MEQEYDTDMVRTYHLKDGTKMRAVIEKDFKNVSKSLSVALKQVEKQKRSRMSVKDQMFEGSMIIFGIVLVTSTSLGLSALMAAALVVLMFMKAIE